MVNVKTSDNRKQFLKFCDHFDVRVLHQILDTYISMFLLLTSPCVMFIYCISETLNSMSNGISYNYI